MPQLVRKQVIDGLSTACYEVRAIIKSRQKDKTYRFVLVRNLKTHNYKALDVTRYKRVTKHNVCKIVSKILKVKEENVRLAKHLEEVL